MSVKKLGRNLKEVKHCPKCGAGTGFFGFKHNLSVTPLAVRPYGIDDYYVYAKRKCHVCDYSDEIEYWDAHGLGY